MVAGTAPILVAWGPDAAHRDLYLYFARDDGIYLNTVGDASGGTQVVLFYDYSAEHVHDIEWLPDASGFLYSKKYVNLGIWTNIFEYSFATREVTKLTSLGDDSARAQRRSRQGAQRGAPERRPRRRDARAAGPGRHELARRDGLDLQAPLAELLPELAGSSPWIPATRRRSPVQP